MENKSAELMTLKNQSKNKKSKNLFAMQLNSISVKERCKL